MAEYSGPVIYFEAHINLPWIQIQEPSVFDFVTDLAKLHKFKMSHMNGNDGHPDSETQTILTCHTQTYEEMEFRMKNIMELLKAYAIPILRYKIEAAVTDSRKSDIWHFLSPKD